MALSIRRKRLRTLLEAVADHGAAYEARMGSCETIQAEFPPRRRWRDYVAVLRHGDISPKAKTTVLRILFCVGSAGPVAALADVVKAPDTSSEHRLMAVMFLQRIDADIAREAVRVGAPTLLPLVALTEDDVAFREAALVFVDVETLDGIAGAPSVDPDRVFREAFETVIVTDRSGR